MKKLSPLFKKIIPQKVSVKLALIFCLIVATLLVVLGMGLTNITRKALKYEIQMHLQEVANHAAGEVLVAIERPVQLIRVASQFVGRSQLTPEEIKTILIELSIQFSMFNNIFYVDKNGKQIASSNLDVQNYSKEWKENAAFQVTQKGETYYSDIKIDDDFMPHTTVAIPSFSLGQVSGTLIADINLRGIWKIIDDLKIGKTGSAFLLDQDGRVIAHKDKQLVLKNIKIGNSEIFKNIKNKDHGNFEYQLKNGDRYLSAYTSLDTNFNISLIVQQTTDEAYRFLQQMKYLIWIMVFISIVITIFVSALLARWLVRPVKSLQEWSRKVALGDFDYSVSPSSSDEMGKLFIMFKRMSHRLKIAREKEHLAFLGEAAASITHRLKNSIVGLKTFSQLIPKKKNDPQFMDTFEEKFSDNVVRLEGIFKNLSKVSSSQQMKDESVDLRKILENVHDQFRETLEQEKISVNTQLDIGLPEIRGDNDQLSELFVNLIQNAIQAMPHGGFLKIHALTLANKAGIEVSIIDSGEGISEEDQRKILRPFYTTKSNGMGLGLAICKKITDYHKAKFDIKSIPGEGTAMKVVFPLSVDLGTLSEQVRTVSV